MRFKEEKKGEGLPTKKPSFYFYGVDAAKWDRCVDKVKKAGTAENPYAVCTAQLGAPESEKKEGGGDAEPQLQPAQLVQDAKAEDVQTLIVQNPQMNAASFYNLLKAKGFHVTKEAIVSAPPLARAGVEAIPKSDATRESSALGKSYFNFRFVEAAVDKPQGDERYRNRFRVVLIQEGLGNTKDGYFYTKEALKSAVPVFEGRKFYADHPDAIEEETRPERSVRDVYGHFENVEYKEAADGTGQLHGDVVVLPDTSSDWVRARMVHAISYSKKYPDKDFIGLSINASGDAEPVAAEEFLSKGEIVESAKQKLLNAISEGLREVKVVKLIDSAISCDLVTEAGARGKVLELLEGDKMKKKHEAEEKKHEAEEKKHEAEEKKHESEAEEKKEAADEEKPEEEKPEGEEDEDEEKDGVHIDVLKHKEEQAHDDEEQDKALILDMLKKHGLVKEGEEAEAMEAEKAAKHYLAAYKACGYDAKEAAERACEAMKCAKHAHEAHESEAKKESEAEEKKHESEAKKESAEILKLKGENAKLVEKLAKIEVETYLDKKLKESRLPMSVTKKFKESVKAFKSKADVDEKFNLFIEGYKSLEGGEAQASSLEDFVMVEKSEMRESKGGISLEDCVEL